MGQRRLARPQPRAAADDRRRRGRVVRSPERPHRDQRPARGEQAGHRVDAGDLEGLLVRERRQDSRQAPGEHRLSDAGRAREDQVVRPRGGDLERPSRSFLPPDVGEVGRRGRPAADRGRSDLGRVALAAQVGDRVREVLHRHDADARQRRLARRLGGAEDVGQAGAPRALRHGEDAADEADAAVEGDLPDRRVPRERLLRDLPGRGEHGQGDRQVEARPLLSQLGGSEVDGDPPARPLELGGLHPAADALARLLARPVGEPDDRERGHLAVEPRLDLDTARLEAHEGVRDGAGEHGSTVGVRASRMGDGVEPGPCRFVPGAGAYARATSTSSKNSPARRPARRFTWRRWRLSSRSPARSRMPG